MKAFLIGASALALAACTGGGNNTGTTDANGATPVATGTSTPGTPASGPSPGTTLESESSSCGDDGTDLSGATWSVDKSRFAFGGMPVETPEGGRVIAWIGTDGRATVEQFGYVGASLNGGAAAASRPNWSGGSDLVGHVESYLMTFGIPACQIGNSSAFGSVSGGGAVGGTSTTVAGQTTVVLSRVVDGIAIVESQAHAAIDDQDQSTNETLYWPTIPAATVSAAKSLRDQLKDPNALATYKAKLPDNARSADGEVAIHHTFMVSSGAAFKAVATWDAHLSDQTLSFDATGAMVTLDF